MTIIPRSLAFVLCLVLRVSSQPPSKPIGEWSPNRADAYPNPWVDSEKCKTLETSGLCDYNQMLTVEQRTYFSVQPGLKKVSDGNIGLCLCNLTCVDRIRINITMAIMKKIGPHITDYIAAAQEFTEKFRVMWSLNNCSVILVASKGDNTSFLDVGSDVNSLLSVNLTEKIYQNISNFFSAGLFVEGLNATLNEFRKALAEKARLEKALADKALGDASRTTVPPVLPQPTSTCEDEARGGSSAVIIGVLFSVVIYPFIL